MFPFLHWAYKASLEHEAVLGLLGLALVITMRPTLPTPFSKCQPLEWVYEWLHDALKTFVSFKSPQPSTSPNLPTPTPGQKV